MISSGIIGVGRYLPKNKVTTEDFIRQGADLETLKRWGVSEHRIAEHETVIEMEVKAGLEAIESAGLEPDDIDLVIGSTIGPLKANPPNVNLTINELGIRNAAAFEVNQSCNSPIPAMIISKTFLNTEIYKNVLLIASSFIKYINDPTDPAIYAVLGDGASAIEVGKVDDGKGFLNFDLLSCGQYWNRVGIEKKMPKYSKKYLNDDEKYLFYVDMKEELGDDFRHYIVKSVPDSVQRLLEKEGFTIEKIDWVIPHQNVSNIFLSWVKKLKIDLKKVISTHEKYGNLGPANIWTNLYEGVENKIIKKGDVLLFMGQGSGFSVGSMLLRW